MRRAKKTTLTNAGTRYYCWEGTFRSCSGLPRDNNLKALYKATAYQ